MIEYLKSQYKKEKRTFLLFTKSLGLPNKSCKCIVRAFVKNKIVKRDTKLILKTFKNFLFKPSRRFVGETSEAAKSKL